MNRPDQIDTARAKRCQDEPAFAAPWEAEAFAIVVALQDAGVIAADEWAQTLSAELHRPEARADGSDYYQHWLAALEKLLADKGLTEAAAIAATTEAWKRAARATPHGSPILLENDPGI